VTNMLIEHIPLEDMIGPIPVLFSPAHVKGTTTYIINLWPKMNLSSGMLTESKNSNLKRWKLYKTNKQGIQGYAYDSTTMNIPLLILPCNHNSD